MSNLPSRAPRLSIETVTEILRLDVHGQSQAAIAREAKVHPRTVKRVLERIKATAGAMRPIEEELARALRVYREVQRTAWEGIASSVQERGRVSAMLLAEIRLSQQRVDQLLGLEPVRPEVIEIRQYQGVVLDVLAQETPEARLRLAQRFREIAGGADA
jgi:Helix-turn-helix domain